MTRRTETEARQAVVQAAQALPRLGLSVATTGNVSVRWGDGMLITPSGVRYEALTADAIVRLRDAHVVVPDQRPSSEWRFHAAAYRARPDRQAVVHCHSPHATTIACTGRSIPPFHYLVAALGGEDIPCIGYAPFGSEELAALVGGALADRDACLMAHHGQVSIGVSLEEALDLACIVEDLARVYLGLLQLGAVTLLDEAAVRDAVTRMADYRAGMLNPP